MRELLLNLSQLAGMQIVLALTAIIRAKILALRLDASGYGEFTQIAAFISTVSVVVAFGLGVGINRNAAAAKSPETRQMVLASANFVVWTLSVVAWLCLLLLFWQRPSVLQSFGLVPTSAVIWSVVLLAAFIPVDVTQNNLIAFLTGILDIKGLTSGRSVAVMAGTLLSIPLVWFFGLVGAALQMMCISLTLVWMLARRCAKLGYFPWRVRVHWPTVAALAAFGLASLASGFGQRLSDVWVRAALIQQTSAAQNGYYQAALSLAYQVKTIVLSSVGSYSLATLSQDADRKTIVRTANQLLEAVLPIAILSLGLLGLLSLPLVVMLYRASFLEATQYLPVLLLATFFEVFVWVIGAPLLALRKIKTWLLLELVFVAVRWAASLLLLPVIGVQAVVVGYLIAILLHLALNAIVYFLVLDLRVSLVHVRELVTGTAVILACGLLGRHMFEHWNLFAVAAAVWLAYLLFVVYVKVGIGRVRREFKRIWVREAGTK